MSNTETTPAPKKKPAARRSPAKTAPKTDRRASDDINDAAKRVGAESPIPQAKKAAQPPVPNTAPKINVISVEQAQRLGYTAARVRRMAEWNDQGVRYATNNLEADPSNVGAASDKIRFKLQAERLREVATALERLEKAAA